jgi:hypothetical protein
LLFYIYTTYRKAEKASKNEEDFNNSKEDLEKYFDISSYESFLKSYNDYIANSKDKFKKLET